MSAEAGVTVTRSVTAGGATARRLAMRAYRLCDEDEVQAYVELANAMAIAAHLLNQHPADVADLMASLMPDVAAALARLEDDQDRRPDA